MPCGSGLAVAINPFSRLLPPPARALVELTSTQQFRSFSATAAIAVPHWLDAHKLHAEGKKGATQTALKAHPNATDAEKR
jgi:fucose permease